MTTRLNKQVKRASGATVRDGGRVRELIVTLYPGGTLGLRPAKTRREEAVALADCYSLAVRQRVSAERAAKKGKR